MNNPTNYDADRPVSLSGSFFITRNGRAGRVVSEVTRELFFVEFFGDVYEHEGEVTWDLFLPVRLVTLEELLTYQFFVDARHLLHSFKSVA